MTGSAGLQSVIIRRRHFVQLLPAEHFKIDHNSSGYGMVPTTAATSTISAITTTTKSTTSATTSTPLPPDNFVLKVKVLSFGVVILAIMMMMGLAVVFVIYRSKYPPKRPAEANVEDSKRTSIPKDEKKQTSVPEGQKKQGETEDQKKEASVPEGQKKQSKAEDQKKQTSVPESQKK
uniref:Glycophorin-A n=1 Tax=Steinernema glaseri TaxID=37863 RepID=A0A1I7YAV4_9BILA